MVRLYLGDEVVSPGSDMFADIMPAYEAKGWKFMRTQ